MRVVIDSNVFLSGLIGKEGSAPQLVLEAFGADQIDVVVCPRLLEELEGVLARPKFAGRTTTEQRGEYVARIRDQAELARDPEPAAASVRDPKDEYIVALARAERVDAIVTGDRDLLDAGLRPHQSCHSRLQLIGETADLRDKSRSVDQLITPAGSW